MVSNYQFKKNRSPFSFFRVLRRISSSRFGVRLTIIYFVSLIAQPLYAIEWSTVPIIQQSDYQKITESPSGSGNWTGAFGGPLPFRLIGVVLNNSEDWLDSTANYTSTITPWYMGGQAEILVQAVNLDGTQWDPNPSESFDDFGGTSCWMGQNYGNMPWITDPGNSYTNAAWYNELNRLQLWHPDTPGLPSSVAQPVRKGDLVEIRTSVGGLYYDGKMNVNEQHSNDPSQDFEVVVLQHNYGLPAAAELTLSDLKNADNSFVFDSAAPRDSGAEHYQMSLIKLRNVHLTNSLLWGPNMDLKLTDDTGRNFNVHLGLNAGFYSYMAPGGTYDVTGIIDQESGNGRDGYRLLTLDASSYSAIPSIAAPIWNGGGGSDTRWSITANWSSPGPINGWELHFDGNTSLNTLNNSPSNSTFAGIVFNPNAGSFTLSGNSIMVNRVANFSNIVQTIDLSLNTDDANCLFLAEPGNIIVSKPIVGGHGLEKYGSAALRLTAVNTYTGTTDIESGLLILSDGGTIDSSSAIQVCSGATLQFDGGEHYLSTIFGEGDTLLTNAAQITVDSLVQNTVTLGAGCRITINPIPGGPQASAECLSTVPEPSAMLLLMLGLAFLTALRAFREKYFRCA
jgi:autotransporter-associated beta strand protein